MSGPESGRVTALMNKPIKIPATPPTRLITAIALNDNGPTPETCDLPLQLEVNCPGNSATVEVILADSAVMPVSISAGRVRNVPPPASAFCMPAHNAAAKRSAKVIMLVEMAWL